MFDPYAEVREAVRRFEEERKTAETSCEHPTATVRPPGGGGRLYRCNSCPKSWSESPL
jgi:hypothetical protein